MKSDDGVILVEMLVSVVVVGCIMFLMLNLMYLISAVSEYDQVFTNSLQLDSSIIEDIQDSTAVSADDSCLYINLNEKEVEYCFKSNNLIRTVDAKGYERLMSDVDGEFTNSQLIALKIKHEEVSFEMPIWKSNE